MQIVKSPYLNENLTAKHNKRIIKNHPDFDKIWYTTAHLELDDSHVTKSKFKKKIKMADTRLIENHILAITQESIARF